MERNPKQQKQGESNSLESITFMLPDPRLAVHDFINHFTDHWPWIPVNGH